MKSKWNIVQLGNFLREISVKNRQNSEGKVYSVTNSQGFVPSTEYFDKEVYSKNLSNYKIVRKGQFAYNPSRINVGSIDYLRETDSIIVSPLYIVFQANENYVSNTYLKAFLKSTWGSTQIKNKARGSVRDTLSFKKLCEVKVPLPPISDQNKVVSLLRKAEQLIVQRKESLRLLDELVKSSFVEMFGDPHKNEKIFPFFELQDICSEIVDCPHTTPLKSKQVTEFACIRTSELKDGYIFWDSMQYVEEPEYKKRISRLIPKEGDIVYGREGSFGEAVRIPSYPNFCLGQRTMLLRPDQTKCNSTFLWAMVRSDFVYRQALRKNSGSTVGHVNVKDIRKFKVFLPPIELQDQFAHTVEKIETLKAHYQKSLAELENLYSSLSQRAFSGELDLSKVEIDFPVEISQRTDQKPIIEEPQSRSYQDTSVQVALPFDEVTDETVQANEDETIVSDPLSLDTILRVIKKKGSMNFEQLWSEISLNQTMENYKPIKDQLFGFLTDAASSVEQYFNENTKQIEFRIHEAH